MTLNTIGCLNHDGTFFGQKQVTMMKFWAVCLGLASVVVHGQNCPKDSLKYCDDPKTIMDDPTVACSEDTCRWNTNRLRQDQKPELCKSITIVDVATLPDYLEPCYWWEVRFGDFAPSAAPSTTPAPTITPVPTARPSSSPTTSPPPSLTPSDQPSDAPSFVNSALNETLSNSTTTVDDRHTDVNGTELNETGVYVDSNPTNVTEDQVDVPQISLPSIETGSDNESETTVDDNEETAVPFDTLILTYLVKVSRRQLLRARHLLVDSMELLNVTTTHLQQELQATVHLIVTPVDEQPVGGIGSTVMAVSEALDGRVLYTGTAPTTDEVNAWVLRAFRGQALSRYVALLQDSTDTALAATASVYLGLPSQADMDKAQNGSTPSPWQSPLPFEWNVFWIAVIAAGGAAFLAICLATICLCRRRRLRRRAELQLAIAKSRSTMAASSDDKSPTASAQEVDLAAGQDEFDVANIRDDESIDEQSHAGRYPMSESTSVYSYIEPNTICMDDQTYSIAPSLLYGNLMPDEESGSWSVNDGLSEMADKSLSEYFTAGYGHASSTPINPAKSGGHNMGKMLIFADGDEDDISIVSDLPNNANRGDEKMDVMGLDDKPRTVEVSPYEKIDWSLNDYTREDDSSQMSDMESLGQQRLPFTNLSRVDESRNTSLYSSSSSTASSASRSQKTSKMTNEENLLNNKHVNKALGCESSDTDDSSLFMGPNVQGGKQAVVLNDNDKIVSARDDLRFGPLARGGRRLTRKEKQHLGLGNKELEESHTFSLPQSYSQSEEKKDDASVSSTGSGKGGHYPIVSMASF